MDITFLQMPCLLVPFFPSKTSGKISKNPRSKIRFIRVLKEYETRQKIISTPHYHLGARIVANADDDLFRSARNNASLGGVIEVDPVAFFMLRVIGCSRLAGQRITGNFHLTSSRLLWGRQLCKRNEVHGQDNCRPIKKLDYTLIVSISI